MSFASHPPELQAIARKSADAMWVGDNATRALGMQLQCVSPGGAVIQRTVAAGCQISYLAPVKLGAELIASAHERFRAERSGITDVTVTDETGAIVAEFRGNSRTIAGTLFPLE
jgi:acyl-CoA thioesterase